MEIQVDGTLDVFFARRFLDVALECLDAGLDTVVRCQALERMDASALQVLVALRKGLAGQGQSLWFSDVSAKVREYLQIAGLDDIDPPEGQASPETVAGPPSVAVREVEHSEEERSS
jgi:anti-anti-sigma factor